MWSFGQSCFKTISTLSFRHHLKAQFLLLSLSMARRLRKTKMPFNEKGWGIPASALSRYYQMEIEFRVCLFWQAAISITHKLQKPAFSGVDVFLRQPVCTFILSMQLRACFFSSPSRTIKEPSFWCEQAEAKSSVRKANSELRLIDFKTAYPLFPR